MAENELTEKQIAERRDAAILRALKTPPKPHKELIRKAGKSPKRKVKKER